MKIRLKNTSGFLIAFLFGCYLCIAQQTPQNTTKQEEPLTKQVKKTTPKDKKVAKDTTSNKKITGTKGDLKIVTSKKEKRKKPKKIKKIRPYEPLAPARAAFYSAVLPGLGQAYTGNYWKIPIVYTAIGGGIYYYTFNNRIYTEARDIYKRRLAGFRDDRFINPITGLEIVTDDSLLNRQRRFRKARELALLLTTLGYILNIVDANVSAHLQQYNINNDLSLLPNMEFDELSSQPSFGLKLNYNF